MKLKITGMTCAGCSNHIHEALTKREGVLDNLVEYPGDSALVTYDPEKITVKEIIEAIVAAGYKAEKLEDKEKEKLNHR